MKEFVPLDKNLRGAVLRLIERVHIGRKLGRDEVISTADRDSSRRIAEIAVEHHKNVSATRKYRRTSAIIGWFTRKKQSRY